MPTAGHSEAAAAMSIPPTSTLTDTFEIPNPFGRYRILRKLGQGGMGSVYLALDTELNREVALKIPRELAGQTPEVLARFRREAQVLAALKHPNICRVLDIGEFEGRHYLTMEYHEGKPLDVVLVPGKPMKPSQAVKIIRKLALAMQKAHDQGIMHRDLKPANVLLTAEKDLILLDFGLARVVEEDSHRLSLTGDMIGTPAYMSPEQVKADPSKINTSTDVYSLGVMLYEMLCGRRPFNGPVHQVLFHIVNEKPESPSKFHPPLDPGLEAVCLKAMQKEQACRYVSMSEFSQALSDWLTGQNPTHTPTSESLILIEPLGQKPLADVYGRLLVPTSLATAAVLLGVVFYMEMDEGPSKIVNNDPKIVVPLKPTPVASAQRIVPRKQETSRLPTPAAGSRPGEERDDNDLKMKFCWCPPDTFMMGSPPDEEGRFDDEEQVEVTLTRGFWLGKYEVTQGQWRRLMGTTLSDLRPVGALSSALGRGTEYPMYGVDHAESQEFCRKLTVFEREVGRLPANWEYRLPTEAEWEYACRAGSKGAYGLAGDVARLGDYAWFKDNSDGHPQPVGKKRPNAFGLHDMLGNINEWCLNGYREKHTGGQDPRGPLASTTGVFRGGFWADGPSGVRAARRDKFPTSFGVIMLGFRCAIVQITL